MLSKSSMNLAREVKARPKLATLALRRRGNIQTGAAQDHHPMASPEL